MLRRHIVLVVIVGLDARHALGEVEKPAIRTVGRGGHIIGQIREAGVGDAAPVPRQAVMLVIAETAGPGLSGPAAARGLPLRAVTVHRGYVVTWKQARGLYRSSRMWRRWWGINCWICFGERRY